MSKEKKPFYKKWWFWGLIALIAIMFVGCGDDSSSSENNNSAKSEKTSNDKSIKTSKLMNSNNKNDNTYKNDTFTMEEEKLTYKITGVKWLPSAADENKKTLVLECDITNNGDKPVDLAVKGNPYTYIHATQKTENEEKQLQPGTLKLESDGNSPEQSRENTMNSSSVLPHKTAQGIIKFDTVNDSPVTVSFENEEFKVIGSKTYSMN